MEGDGEKDKRSTRVQEDEVLTSVRLSDLLPLCLPVCDLLSVCLSVTSVLSLR